MHILVVEDEVKVASFLRQALEEEGYAVEVAYDGEAGLAHAQGREYDLILLDHLLPRLSGIALCRHLRDAKIEIPILMVTARDATEEKIIGLDAGADDYLTKPFSIAELLARVRALLRRGWQRRTTLLRVEDLTLDPQTRLATRGDRTVELSSREYALLNYLMPNAHRPITRTMIAERCVGLQFCRGQKCFNSSLVRLNAQTSAPSRYLNHAFQFHPGSIKSA